MGKLLSVIAVIFAVCIVTCGIALGFAGIGVDTASGRQIQTIENTFDVELSVVTAEDNTSIAVVRTEDGYNIDAEAFIQAYHGQAQYVPIYTIENGIITGQNAVVITFSTYGLNPDELKDVLGMKQIHAKTD